MMRWQAVVLIAAALVATTAAADDVVFARYLALSPDGQTLAFSWAGDVWSVPSDGGQARRLSVHEAYDSHPVFSPDGRHVAIASRRHGAANVFVMKASGADVRRVTFGDRSTYPCGWSAGGEDVHFYSLDEGQQHWEPRMYRVPAVGGQAWPLLRCFGRDARWSPDGEQVVFVRGYRYWGWWRRGYRGSGNADLWLFTPATGEFRQLTDFDGNDEQPYWDADGTGVYFTSDRSGTVNVWHLPLAGGDARQVTHFDVDDVRDLAVSADGGTLAFTYWDQIYGLRPGQGEPQRIQVTAASDVPFDPREPRTLRGGADEYAASPDGEEIAVVVRGEIFVTKTEDDKPTRRVTQSAARDRHVTWSPDGKALFFVSDRTGNEQVFRATSAEEPPKPLSESLRFRIEQVTDAEQPSFLPRVSPDGKELAIVRLRGDIVVRDLEDGAERRLVSGFVWPRYQWSPDSRWIAYSTDDNENNGDVWIVPADGDAEPVNISRHPDEDYDPQWSADGQILAFSSQRHGFDMDLYFVFLSPELDELSSVALAEYFEQAAEQVKKAKPPEDVLASGDIRLAGEVPPEEPTTAPSEDDGEDEEQAPRDLSLRGIVREALQALLKEPPKPKSDKDEAEADEDDDPEYAWELDTAWRRVRTVTELADEQIHFALHPDGSTLVFTSGHENGNKLFAINWDGSGLKTLRGDNATGLAFDPSGQRVYYLRGGVPASCTASGGSPQTHTFRAKMIIDYAAQAAQKFDDAARALERGFYHPRMKGRDWPALTAKYRDLALRVPTDFEFNDVVNMLMGELNASHMGIGGGMRGTSSVEAIGYLGCTFDPHHPGPGLRVATILEDGPADRAESRLHVGDVILAVDGEPVGPHHALDAALIDTVGQEVVLQVRRAAAHAPTDTDAAAAADESTDEAAADAPPGAEEASAADDGDAEYVAIRPVSYGTFTDLAYEADVRAARAYVERASDGQVGYVNIRRMHDTDFYTFERDLYAAGHGRQGLIIDVRNNGGGWTADWVMAVLDVRRHAVTVNRGAEPGYPQGRLLVYAWTRLATMMCNQYSFSNAEIVAHAFKTLGRGPLVGMPTFGGVISTGSYELIDGSRIRMPLRGWYVLPEGADMELNGARPDIIVPITPDDEVHGRRPQLDAAIEATLQQIEAGRAEEGM